jgi:hypothetical protein
MYAECATTPIVTITGELTVASPPSDVLACCAAAINRAKAKTVEAIFEIGEQLQIAHDELAHHGDGHFGRWARQACGMSRSAAYDAMNVIAVFGAHRSLVCPPGGQTFDVKALAYMSRATTPSPAVMDALQLAAQGERVTLARAKKLVAKYTVEQATGDFEKQRPTTEAQQENFESAVREVANRWWELCSPEERISIPDLLRRVADEMEVRLGANSNDRPEQFTAAGALPTIEPAANDDPISLHLS